MNVHLLVKDMMKKEVFVLNEELSIAKAIDLLRYKGLFAAAVVDANDELVGFLSIHDLMVDVWCKDYEPSQTTLVRDLMSKNVTAVDVNDSFIQVMEMLSIDKQQLYPISVQGIGTYNHMTAISVEERAKEIHITKPQILPVVENNRVVGEVSRMEVMKVLGDFYSDKHKDPEPYEDLAIA